MESKEKKGCNQQQFCNLNNEKEVWGYIPRLIFAHEGVVDYITKRE